MSRREFFHEGELFLPLPCNPPIAILWGYLLFRNKLPTCSHIGLHLSLLFSLTRTQIIKKKRSNVLSVSKFVKYYIVCLEKSEILFLWIKNVHTKLEISSASTETGIRDLRFKMASFQLSKWEVMIFLPFKPLVIILYHGQYGIKKPYSINIILRLENVLYRRFRILFCSFSEVFSLHFKFSSMLKKGFGAGMWIFFFLPNDSAFVRTRSSLIWNTDHFIIINIYVWDRQNKQTNNLFLR